MPRRRPGVDGIIDPRPTLVGEWPSGKAADSGSANRRFESSLPSRSPRPHFVEVAVRRLSSTHLIRVFGMVSRNSAISPATPGGGGFSWPDLPCGAALQLRRAVSFG